MKTIILILLLSLPAFAGTVSFTNGNGSVIFYQSDIPTVNPATAGGNMASATNLIHSTNILVTGDRTITALEAAQSASAYFTFLVDSSPSNIALTFPEDFNFKIIVLNIGTNWVNYVAPADRRFALAPFGGGISYSTNLFNKYALKAHTVKQYGTNFYVVDDFAPLPNFVYNVTNNLPLLAALAAGDGSGLSGVSATIAVGTTNQFLGTNALPALTNGYLRTVAIAITDTNTFAATNNTVWFLRQDQRVSLTNGFITTADFPQGLTNQFAATNNTQWFDRASDRVSLTNGYIRGIAVGDTNGYLRAISVTDTNKLLSTNYTGNTFISGTDISSNGFSSTVSNLFPVTAKAITASVTNFFTNTFGFSILVNYQGPTITGIGKTGTNAGVGGAFLKLYNGTNGCVGLRNGCTLSITNGATAGNMSWYPFP